MASRLVRLPGLIGRRVGTTQRSYASQSNTADPRFPEETFGKIWRNAALLVLVGATWYQVDKALARSHGGHPITQWLKDNMTKEDEWQRINEKHLEQAVSAAEDKLLFQEAQRAPIFRMRYPESFEQASPHAISVGSQADVSDVNVKF
ncbi:hypothetical protein BZG36_02680 [Bifiguratus adelaidae]|uniref:Uncharacterized protein n=1 Tax=Bifiguratus adelaidae TaxID=1938954 RepID=A0A261Y1L0_9FUNG|nr:hypothetical protein BZG36_02680 [Bifiguratus adelaidae]